MYIWRARLVMDGSLCFVASWLPCQRHAHGLGQVRNTYTHIEHDARFEHVQRCGSCSSKGSSNAPADGGFMCLERSPSEQGRELNLQQLIQRKLQRCERNLGNSTVLMGERKQPDHRMTLTSRMMVVLNPR